MSEEPLHERFKLMTKYWHKNKILAENTLPHSSPNHNSGSVSKINYGNGLNIFQSLPKVSKVLVKIELSDCTDFYVALFLTNVSHKHFMDIQRD